MEKPRTSRLLSQIIYGGLVIGLLFSGWLIFRTKPLSVEVGVVTRGEFVDSLLIDGKLRSKTKNTIVAFASGDISEIKLKPGDSIRRGESITVLKWDYNKEIKSPLSGVVVKVFRQNAGPVIRGEPLVEIVDPEELEIVAEPLTSDALRLNEGADVEVSGMGEDLYYKAKVRAISRAGFVKTSALGVEEERTEIRMNFIEPPQVLIKRIGDNFHVELKIFISREEGVLMVSLGALFKNQDQWSVYKMEGDRARMYKVQVVKKNDRVAVIDGGLKEGDRIILFPSDQILDGTLVK